MVMNVYEVTVINEPSDKQRAKGAKTSVVLSPKTFLAADANVAILRCKKWIPKPFCFHLDNLKVTVRQVTFSQSPVRNY